MKTIFRMLKGEVIALFPTEPASTSAWWNCESYAHVGQHGACDPHIAREGRLAFPVEYEPLARELRGLGYVLTIGKRITQSDHNARRVAWAKQHCA